MEGLIVLLCNKDYCKGGDFMTSSDASFVAVYSTMVMVVILSVLFTLLLMVPIFILQYKMVTQAGKPGWSIFIPFYNSWVFAQIALGDKFGWVSLVTIALPIVPIVGAIASAVLSMYIRYKYAEAFGLGPMKCVLFAFLYYIMAIYLLVTKEWAYVGCPENLISKHLDCK